MKLLDGKQVAEKILVGLKKEIQNRGSEPGLAVILVGNNPASELYVSLKAKAAKRVGIRFKLIRFSTRAAESKILTAIKQLNADKNIDGMIVQLPLPIKFHTQKIINAIDPGKDVDGFHPDNIKQFISGQPNVYPVFPLAIMKLLEATKVKLGGKNALIIANSKEFGSVMQAALKFEKAKSKYILSKDFNKNRKLLKGAGIIISAVGKPGLVNGNLLKKGAIVIDGGITKTPSGVVGDVDFKSAKKIAGFISPVPGGVGPVTIACLLQNVVSLAKNTIKAVIFDMDGVITDTEILHATVVKEILREYSIEVKADKIINKYSGVPVKVSFKEIFTKNNIHADIGKLVERKQQLMMERSKGQVKPVNGVLELIREFRRKGFKIAIGTSSQRELAHLFLSELGLIKMFKVIVTLDDVKNGKPDPEIFLLAAKKLEVAPRECVVIEDGRSGMLAARRAGMKCVGLVKDRNSKNYPADILVESLKELIDFNFNDLL